MPTTKSWKKYVEEWDSYIGTFGILRLTPSRELSQEVSVEMERLKALVRKIADDKKLNKDKNKILKEVL